MSVTLPHLYVMEAQGATGPVSAREAWGMLMSGALRVDGAICWVGEDAWRPAREALLAPISDLAEMKRKGHWHCRRLYAHPWPVQRLIDCVDAIVPAQNWRLTGTGQGQGVRVFNVGDEVSQRMAGSWLVDLGTIAGQITVEATPDPAVADDGCTVSVEFRSVYYVYHDGVSKRKYRERHAQVVRILASGLL